MDSEISEVVEPVLPVVPKVDPVYIMKGHAAEVSHSRKCIQRELFNSARYSYVHGTPTFRIRLLQGECLK